MMFLVYMGILFLILNFLFDIIHICNFILVSAYSGWTYVRGRNNLLDENVFQSICLTSDIDYLMHMNNSRYLRDCDLARIKLWGQTGVLRAIRKQRATLVLGGSVVRYRKSINLFDIYKIKSKIQFWDSKAFYLEQKFVRQSDSFICCVILAKQSAIGITTEQTIEELGYTVTKPECPPEVSKFIEYNEILSEKFRTKTS